MFNRVFRLGVLALLIVVVIVAEVMRNERPAFAEPGGPFPIWVSDKNELSRLGPKCVFDGVAVLPPKGCTVYRQTATRLALNPLGNRGSYFDITVEKSQDSDLAVDRRSELDKRRVQAAAYGWTESSPEWGQINGRKFERIYWQDTIPEGIHFHGVQYSTITTDGNFVAIFGRASDPDSTGLLKTIEAAVMTSSTK